MLNTNKVNEFLQKEIKKAKKNQEATAIEFYSVCEVPIELLTIEEERVINKVLCSLLKSNGYITESSISDFFHPGDFYFKNKGYLAIF